MNKPPAQKVVPAIIAVLSIAAVGSLNGPRHAGAEPQTPRWYDQWRTRPTVSITGTMWDFYKKNNREMDPDFDNKEPKFGKGEYIDIMRPALDSEGKPVFAGGGYKVDSVWMDAQGTPIIWPKKYIAKWSGDHAGESKHKKDKIQGFAVTPEEDVQHWWRDDEGTNETYDAPITFVRSSGPTAAPPKKPKHPHPDDHDADDKPKPEHTKKSDANIYPEGVYVFDSLIPKGTQKSMHLKHGQDDILGMIAQGKAKKKRYSWEGETSFVYEKGSSWWLTVSAMDDVWVYIDDRLVIDLGGAYKGKEKRPFGTQTINLDRLEWLADGGTYSLKIFMVDRDKGSDKSHLKVITNIQTLNLVGPPTVRGLYD